MSGSSINFIIIFIAGIISFLVLILFTPPWINFLKEKYIGQFIREDGPEKHQSKKGTPTMGGLIILCGIITASLISLSVNNYFYPFETIALTSLSGFALIGFIDDYLKVAKKHNKGINGWLKLSLQIVFSGLPVFYAYLSSGDTFVSLFGLAQINLGIIYLPFAMLVIAGSSNAINLTDGLDGLATTTSAISFATLTYLLFLNGQYGLAIISASITGACLGFLLFNHNPAKIFMGDVGSLMLGGAFGILGVLGKIEFWLIPIGIIFVIEALSVIIQVISFKTTGKRVFKMSPLHHHFELCGDNEKTVLFKFSIFQVIFCTLSIILYNLIY